jgi:3-deoxy-D-manno-octulosonic-acid transferase
MVGRGFILFYRLIWNLLSVLVPLVLFWRSYKGKEDSTRLAERYGISGVMRPKTKGRLYWLHGASVGESVSSLVLGMSILKQDKGARILITSGTITSQRMLQDRIADQGLSNRIIPQFHPYDRPRWVRRFLKHWQPDIAVMMESEIWPNMVTITHEKGIPVMMASAQISDKSLRHWTGIFRFFASGVFNSFSKIITIDDEQARRFSRLVQDNIITVGGSMKAAAPPLRVNGELVDKITKSAAGRMVVLLASSHEGEESLFIEAMEAINQSGAYLGIIAPRHVQRGGIIRKLVTESEMSTAQRSLGEFPDESTRIWIDDAMGEMGSLINAADVIVLGGGFAELGGHNPMEMAALGKGVISGPHIYKNATIFKLLENTQGCLLVDNASTLGDTITMLAASSTQRDNLDHGASLAYSKLTDAATETAGHAIMLAKQNKQGRKS